MPTTIQFRILSPSRIKICSTAKFIVSVSARLFIYIEIGCRKPGEEEHIDMIYDMIYLLTVIWLTRGGSSTEHIYTQTIHRTTQ